jgi:hypothetical protein
LSLRSFYPLPSNLLFNTYKWEKLKFGKCWKAQLTGMRKRAGKKEYKEKDRQDGGRMIKRWRGGRRDTTLSLHVHACLSYYYYHCWYPLSSTFNYYVFHHIHEYKCTQEKSY